MEFHRLWLIIHSEVEQNAVSGDILLKVPMNWKIIAAYLKGFSTYRRMAFSFLEYLFSFKRYWHFCIMQISQSDDVISCAAKTVKYWIKNISRTIGAVFFCILKSLSNKQQLFSVHRHFKRCFSSLDAIRNFFDLPLHQPCGYMYVYLSDWYNKNSDVNCESSSLVTWTFLWYWLALVPICFKIIKQ